MYIIIRRAWFQTMTFWYLNDMLVNLILQYGIWWRLVCLVLWLWTCQFLTNKSKTIGSLELWYCYIGIPMLHLNNTLRPRQSGRQFPDDIFKCFFFLEFRLEFYWSLLLRVQLPLFHHCRLGNKPSSEPMMVRLPTHICITRPQRDNLSFIRIPNGT